MTVFILISVHMCVCPVGASTHLYGLVCAGECVATVCLAGVSVPFSNYFVSHFASLDLWHIAEFSMQSCLFLVALSLLFLEQ